MLSLLLVQVLVLNQIHLLGCITPLLIGYMVISLHRGTSHIVALLWGFAIGLVFDMFNNTAGMASAAMTLLAMVQPPLLSMFTPRDASDDMAPSFKTIGVFSYILYTLLLMFLLHCVFYLLAAFSLSDWRIVLVSIIGGTILSTILSIVTEMLVRTRKT